MSPPWVNKVILLLHTSNLSLIVLCETKRYFAKRYFAKRHFAETVRLFLCTSKFNTHSSRRPGILAHLRGKNLEPPLLLRTGCHIFQALWNQTTLLDSWRRRGAGRWTGAKSNFPLYRKASEDTRDTSANGSVVSFNSHDVTEGLGVAFFATGSHSRKISFISKRSFQFLHGRKKVSESRFD